MTSFEKVCFSRFRIIININVHFTPHINDTILLNGYLSLLKACFQASTFDLQTSISLILLSRQPIEKSFNSTIPQSPSLYWLKILLNKLDTSSCNLQGAFQEGYFVNFTWRTSVWYDQVPLIITATNLPP